MEVRNKEKNSYSFIHKTRQGYYIYIIVFIVSVVISSLIILPIPRYYNCNIALAPEIENLDNSNKISSIASSFDVDLASGISQNAIQPTIYPDLMKSNQFVMSLLNIKIQTKNKKIKSNYYNYLLYYQQLSPYQKILEGITKIFKNKKQQTKNINPFMLTKEQDIIFQKIKNNINCDIDIKTGLINISVQDQDPLVAATIADSLRVKLQDFITNYKTTKARTDVKYYSNLVNEAKYKYEKARQQYAAYSDANQNVVLEQYQSKNEDLENNMQLKFNAYSALSTQLQNAQAKVQEHTPSFTIVESASVPIKPAGPKRMAFVFIVTFLSLLFTLIVKNKTLFFTKKYK